MAPDQPQATHVSALPHPATWLTAAEIKKQMQGGAKK